MYYSNCSVILHLQTIHDPPLFTYLLTISLCQCVSRFKKAFPKCFSIWSVKTFWLAFHSHVVFTHAHEYSRAYEHTGADLLKLSNTLCKLRPGSLKYTKFIPVAHGVWYIWHIFRHYCLTLYHLLLGLFYANILPTFLAHNVASQAMPLSAKPCPVTPIVIVSLQSSPLTLY